MRGQATLRRVNAVLGVALLVLFAFHAVGNSFQLFGVGSFVPAVLGEVLLLLAVCHVAIGIILTVATLRAQAQAGVTYPGQNKRFWAARISGFAIAVLVMFHVATFGQVGTGPDDPVRLVLFGNLQLVVHLLLAASLAVHIFTNMHPLMISLGIGKPGGRALDVALAFAVVVVLAAAAFIVYYLRWL